MTALVRDVEWVLRHFGWPEERPAPAARELPVARLVLVMVAGGAIYGAAMGSFSGVTEGHWRQVILSGIKVPFFLGATFLLCLAPYYTANALMGLSRDFPQALRGLVGGLAVTGIVLATLAPFTLGVNASSNNYPGVVLWSALMFGVASLSGHFRLRQHYADLIRAARGHKALLWLWTALFMFVGIQMAWMLRPFVGAPDQPFQWFRPEAWGNAYIKLIDVMKAAVGNL